MQIDEFILLEDDVKQDIVFRQGVLLENYERGHFICDAYEVFKFYVACCFVYNKDQKPIIIASRDRDYLPFIRNRQSMPKAGLLHYEKTC